jgi:hypothetical protein
LRRGRHRSFHLFDGEDEDEDEEHEELDDVYDSEDEDGWGM